MSVEWMLIRGSGVVAFALLAVSVIWGLMLTTKVLGRWAKAKPLTWFHESLAVGAVLATVVHMVALEAHDYIEFAWADILVPGRSDWRPSAVAFGVVGFYGLAIISLSFYLKRFIGLRSWRAIHFGSFGVFISVALHGIYSGTDSSEPWMIALYWGSIVAVGLLVLIRLAQQYASPPPRRPSGDDPDANRQTVNRVSTEA
ncbi:MAG: ferric reductase-like transmembrane domain-containing protein [Acidimicrobiia bacterium]|jgi:predicted ferric reductase